MGNTTMLIILAVLLVLAVCVRLGLPKLPAKKGLSVSLEKEVKEHTGIREAAAGVGISQTTGTCELQSDCAQVNVNRAGVLAVLADGIGKANTGKLSAQIALDTVLDRYEPYHVLNNPEYFFRTAFYEANIRIQKTIGERRGGACLAAVFLNGKTASYALAGDVRIALLRGRELIPISQGHTIDVLAAASYREGKISRKEALWSQEEKQVFNYLGMDGFREIETGELPILLKAGDVVLMASRGIWQELSWGDLEDILLGSGSLQERAERIVRAAEYKEGKEKENGSILLVEAETVNETGQF